MAEKRLPLKIAAARLVATGFYSGYAPKLSGTVGSLACVAVVELLSVTLGILFVMQWMLVFALVTSAAGIYATKIVLDNLEIVAPDTKAVNKKAHLDPSIVVIDEWAGMLFSLVGVGSANLLYVFIAFAFFRVFDILKPGPVGWAERLPGAWGIMLDDIVAGIFVCIVMNLAVINLNLAL